MTNAASNQSVATPATPASDPPAAVLAREVLDQLGELNSDDDPSALAQLFHIYLRVSQEQMDALWLAVAAADAPAIERAAHSLKSGSGSIGALTMSAVCAQLEAAARSATGAEAHEIVARLEPEYARVRAALYAEIARFDAP